MADDNQKDLDFDELHQAVNALMDQAQKGKKAPKSADERPTVHAAERPKPEPAVREQPESDDRVSVTVKRPLPTLTAHRGPRGRAMDVIGPRPKVHIAPPSERPKRQAAPLQPTQQVKPEPLAAAPAMPVADSATPPAQEPPEDLLASIDMKDEPAAHTMTHQKADMPEPAESKPQPTSDESADSHDQVPTLEQKKDEPAEVPADLFAPEPADESTTPFVTTKVEKRPLGAYNAPAEEPVASTAPAPAQAAADSKDTPSPLPNQPQPEELSPEVVAVESAMPDSPVGAADTEDAPGVDGLRTMGIPHQYQEAAKTDDDHARPVFDTKEYHPAIETHVGGHHKQSSLGSWLMVLALILLLIVALGFIYYMINGSLDPSLLFS